MTNDGRTATTTSFPTNRLQQSADPVPIELRKRERERERERETPRIRPVQYSRYVAPRSVRSGVSVSFSLHFVLVYRVVHGVLWYRCFFFFFQLVSNHNLPSKQDRVFRLRLRSTWNETEREKEECDETVKKTKGTSQMTSNHQQVTIVKLW